MRDDSAQGRAEVAVPGAAGRLAERAREALDVRYGAGAVQATARLTPVA